MEKKKTVNLDLKQYGMIFVLIVIYLIFAALTKGATLKPANINNLVMQNGYVVILATGMLLCCLTGNVDLGVGSLVALTGAVCGILLVDMGASMWIAILAALLTGLASGLFVGFFVAYMKVPPFITTLATWLMWRGLTYTVLKAQTKGPFQSDFTFIGSGFLPTVKVPYGNGQIDLVSVIVAIVISVIVVLVELRDIRIKKKYGFALNPIWQLVIKDALIIFIVCFLFFKLGQNAGIPFVLVILAVIVGIYQFITSSTVAGRQIYALGGNRKAASLSGINTDKVFFWVYTNSGLLAAVAGVVLASRNAAATPKAGDGFEMDAIASCYIGGTAVAGGAGTVMGAVVGAFIMGVLNNGMSIYGWSTDIQKIVKGAVLLLAVTADLMSKRKK
ncbi:MAG: sugar ABC transporter permease [Lachnospiraceae bacterium]|nr:sugar ABC transporter permease [Lachnospiraceae bacterium]MCR5320041.1 sugar ABC transporter permease [Lachnospiraceae bacterium]